MFWWQSIDSLKNPCISDSGWGYSLEKWGTGEPMTWIGNLEVDLRLFSLGYYQDTGFSSFSRCCKPYWKMLATSFIMLMGSNYRFINFFLTQELESLLFMRKFTPAVLSFYLLQEEEWVLFSLYIWFVRNKKSLSHLTVWAPNWLWLQPNPWASVLNDTRPMVPALRISCHISILLKPPSFLSFIPLTVTQCVPPWWSATVYRNRKTAVWLRQEGFLLPHIMTNQTGPVFRKGGGFNGVVQEISEIAQKVGFAL